MIPSPVGILARRPLARRPPHLRLCSPSPVDQPCLPAPIGEGPCVRRDDSARTGGWWRIFRCCEPTFGVLGAASPDASAGAAANAGCPGSPRTTLAPRDLSWHDDAVHVPIGRPGS